VKRDEIKILIVDDEPIITLFLHDAILEEGFTNIVVCYDGDSAIKSIKENKPNIIFMDININGPVDGISLVKKYVKYDESVVFYISAYSDPDTIHEALESNPYNYLVKPISENDIKISLGVACNRLCKQQHETYSEKENTVIYLSKSIYYDKMLDKIFDNGSEIMLSKIEDKTLRYLIENHDMNVTCDMFRENVWQRDVANTTIRDVVSRLRKKFPQLHIETVFGSGYILKRFADTL